MLIQWWRAQITSQINNMFQIRQTKLYLTILFYGRKYADEAFGKEIALKFSGPYMFHVKHAVL